MKTIRFRDYIIKYKYAFAGGLTALVITGTAQLTVPRVIRNAIDTLIDSEADAATELLTGYALQLFGLALAIFLFRFLWRIFAVGTSWKISRDLREILFRHLESQPPVFYRKHESGRLMALMTNDIEAVRHAMAFGIVMATDALFLAVLSLTLMLLIDVRLTLLALLPMPFIMLIVTRFGMMLRSRFEAVQAAFAKISARARENFAGIRVIKAFAREEDELAKFSELSRDYFDKNIRLAWIWSNFFPIVTLLSQFSSLIILWAGGLRVIGDRITMGDFVAFNAYIGILTWPMMAIGFVTNMYSRGKASLDRINRILEEEPVVFDRPDAKPLENFNGGIDVKNLSFSYDHNGEESIRDLSMTIRPGEVVGITGRIGSGKSTLVKLLTRLYDPPSGTIFFDGSDILGIELQSLRKSIAIVPQHPFMFSDSIGANVRLGNLEADKTRIEELIRFLQLEDQVDGGRLGFDTVVGEDGITLSGGQKQRATIARGLVKDSRILILDDVLASVDTRTEEEILREIPRLIAGRTTIIIAHRISALRKADRIIVLERGTLVEEGTPDELEKAGGFYAELCKKQKLVNFGLE